MCDDAIDMILCDLQLEDLVNVCDTSKRLKAVAGAVFSRKYARRLFSMDVLRYSHYNIYAGDFHVPVYSKDDETVRISDAHFWLKLMRNFGGFVKHIRIYHFDDNHGLHDHNVLEQLVNYVFDFCDNSLKTLNVVGYRLLTFHRPLRKLKEFCFNSKHLASTEAFDLMPNLRILKLVHFPVTLVKSFPKLGRIDVKLQKDEEVQAFIPFLHLNPQIKYLRLQILSRCGTQHNDHIYASIAAHLTQLKTFKLFVLNQPEVITQHRFRSVESFSIGYGHQRIIFEFDDLKKMTLQWINSVPSYCRNVVKLNKKLKILKLNDLHESFLNESVIQDLLNELPELQKIIVYSRTESRYSTLKDLLGPEWEQYEAERHGGVKIGWVPKYQCFRKIEASQSADLN